MGRSRSARYADRGADDVGKVTMTAADGEEQGDRLLRESLEHIDEQTYVNIFAVGLREVQELGSLSDTAAAQWLYRLTSGLDRVSLYDVIHMLGRTRLRLLNSVDEPSEIRALVSRRDQLQGELDGAGREGPAVGTVGGEDARVGGRQSTIGRRASKEIAARARRLEVAINLKPLWSKRDKIDDQLQRFEGLRAARRRHARDARRAQQEVRRARAATRYSQGPAASASRRSRSGWASTTSWCRTVRGSTRWPSSKIG